MADSPEFEVLDDNHSTQNAPPTKKPHKGRLKGSQSFTILDRNRLLDVEAIGPYGRNLWEKVADQYNAQAVLLGRKEREATYLKQDFATMVGQAKPTGNPNQPEHITRAKHIAADIEHNICLGTLDDGQGMFLS